MLYELSDAQAQFIREVLLGTRYEGTLQQIKQQSDLALACLRALEPAMTHSASNAESGSGAPGSCTPTPTGALRPSASPARGEATTACLAQAER